MIWMAQKCGQMISASNFRLPATKPPGLPPEIDQAFQIVNERGHQPVDKGLPGDVVDQRFVRKTVDQRQHVRESALPCRE